MKKTILCLIILMNCVSVHSAVADSGYRDSNYIAEMKKYEHELFLAAKKDKWDEVIKLADRLLMDMPNHPEVVFLKAEALRHFEKYEEALKHYELGMKMNSCVWLSQAYKRDFYGAMAKCFFKLKRYEKALRYYDATLIGKDCILNDSIEEDMNKVREEFKKSDRYKKIKQLEKELDKAESLGKLDEAIAIADELIELTYKSGQIHYRKAQALALKGKHQEAIKEYKVALEYVLYVDPDKEYHWNTKNPDKNNIHLSIVDSFMALEDFESVLNYYDSLTPFYRDNDSLKQRIERAKLELEKNKRV